MRNFREAPQIDATVQGYIDTIEQLKSEISTLKIHLQKQVVVQPLIKPEQYKQENLSPKNNETNDKIIKKSQRSKYLLPFSNSNQQNFAY